MELIFKLRSLLKTRNELYDKYAYMILLRGDWKLLLLLHLPYFTYKFGSFHFLRISFHGLIHWLNFNSYDDH